MVKICREIEKTIEEEVEKPVEEWVEKTEKKCKQYPWYDPRGWVCRIVTTLVKVVKTVLVTVTKTVTRVVCETVALVLNVVAAVASVLLAIPFLGRIVSQVLNLVTYLVGRVVTEVAGPRDPDRALGLGLCVIVMRTRDAEEPVVTREQLLPALDETVELFYEEANVVLDYEVTVADGSLASASQATDVSCSVGLWGTAGGWVDDLGGAGSIYELLATRYCFDSSFTRLVGVEAPIVVFVVENVDGSEACSLGPLTDYIVVQGDHVRAGDEEFVVGHELGHSLGLTHHDDTDNLMHPVNAGPDLTEDQARTVRRSPHVGLW